MEIAEELKELPPPLAGRWYNRDYYGTLSHNVRAVYQRYMGFYAGNPSNLNPLQPTEAACRYVDYMGGEATVITRARQAYAQGDYRWVAEVAKHVVFANPKSEDGRRLLADALEQMGFQSEAGTWRNAMLMGAHELRSGVPKAGNMTTASPDTIRAMTLTMIFDYMAIRLNGPNAARAGDAVLNWSFRDPAENYVVTVRNGALTYRKAPVAKDANATLSLSRAALDSISLGQTTFERAVQDGTILVTGDGAAVKRVLTNLDSFDQMFNIVTP